MKVVDMDHKVGVKADAAIQHGGVGEKTSLTKKTARTVANGAAIAGKGVSIAKKTADKIAANPVVKAGGKTVAAAVLAADKAVGKIDNETVQLAHKSLHVASSAVRLGGKTVKVAVKATGKVIKTSFKLSRAVAQKIRLAKKKDKPKLKVKTSKLYKAMNAGLAAKKYVLKPAAKAVKAGVKFGVTATGTVVDKAVSALGSSNDETVQFAKKAYDVAKTAGAITYKAGKGSVRVIKTTGKTARKLMTKKGRRGLVKSVKRSVQRVKRTVRNIKNAVKFTIKAAKFIAKMAAKAAQLAAKLVAKVVNLIVSTAPWSLIVLAVVAVLVIAINVVIAICGDETENQTAGLVGKDGDYTELYENLAKFEEIFAEVSKEKITDPLKKEVEEFCYVPDDDDDEDDIAAYADTDTDTDSDSDDVGDAPPIIEYNSTVYYPASGKGETICKQVEEYTAGKLSKDRYVSMLAALKVLTLRETGDRPLDSFTKADFENFIGTVNKNVCSFGGTKTFDTFFIKTTNITYGETCPDEKCKRKKYPKSEPGEPCASRETKYGVREYCAGHCPNDHTKLTVTLKTVEEHYGKTVPQIYGFSVEETILYDGYVDFMRQALEEMNDPDNPYTPYNPTPDETVSIPDYIEPTFDVSSRDMTVLIVFVMLIIVGFVFKEKKGG